MKSENISNKNEIRKSQKVVTTNISITSNNNNKNSITSKDLTITDEMIRTYNDLINSNYIKQKVQEDYPNASEIRLEKAKDTEIIKVIYVCDMYSDDECIEITRKYISEFSNKVEEIYNVKLYIVDEPEISTKVVIE